MSTLPATDTAATDPMDLMPRWLRRSIEATAQPMPALPFHRMVRRHPGVQLALVPRPVAIAAR